MGRWMFSCLQECRAPSHVTVAWKGKHYHSQCLPPFSSSFIGWAWCHVAWNISLVSQGQLAWLCCRPASCVLQVSSLVGCGVMPWHLVSAAEQKWKHLCIINPLFSTNPNEPHISTGMFLFISSLFYGDKWMQKVLAILLFAFRPGCHSKTMHW